MVSLLIVIQEMALSDTMMQLANAAVLQPGKRTADTAFTAEQRATIGKYTSEYKNKTAQKKFKALYNKDSRYLTDKNT